MGGASVTLRLREVGGLVVLLAIVGCAVPSGGLVSPVLEAAPRADRAQAKIASWQARERTAAPPDTTIPDTLGADWATFVRAERRAQVERVGAWIQSEARARYRPDALFDRWPTTAEAFASQGDDCDGLELLTLQALRALGFPPDSLFRAVLERPADGRQHMVTLWFESPEHPLVIDPTGFASGDVAPLHALGEWTPRAIFNEAAEYRAEGPSLSPAGAAE